MIKSKHKIETGFHRVFVIGGADIKSTVIVRNVDELVRIFIPKEMRKKMNIANGDPVEIYVDGGKIILEKYNERCNFCGSESELVEFKGKLICKKCIGELVSE